jgi:hypothetical protein
MSESETIEEPVATVQKHESGWSRVQYKSWEISIGPDGCLMLPRLLKPEEVEDFVGAALAAAEVGTKMRADNVERAKSDDRSIPNRRVMVTPGGVPEGAVRLPVNFKNTPRGTIGRRMFRRRPNRAQQG